MSYVIRYTCTHYLLPVIEAALMANAYSVEIPLRACVSGAAAMVLTCGAASILIAKIPDSDLAEIEIWGPAQSAAASLLESLPIWLDRMPHTRTVAR